jgi:hypothetical protein
MKSGKGNTENSEWYAPPKVAGDHKLANLFNENGQIMFEHVFWKDTTLSKGDDPVFSLYTRYLRTADFSGF